MNTIALAPFLPTLGSGASSPEHFALMKRCHVSSGRDGLKGHNLLRDLWHCSARGGRGGELPLPVRGEEDASMPEKKAQRCDWCRWTTTSRQSSIWISRPSFRWKRQNQQFADGIWTSEHDNISGSHCAVLFFSHKVHDCVEKNFLFSLLNKSQIEMFFF